MDRPTGYLTVVEQAYHRGLDEQATAVPSGFTCELHGDEQPFGPRHFKIGPEWEPLSCGWLTEASQLMLANDEGRFPQTQPTDEERAAALAKVVEVAADTGAPPVAAWLVRPGRTIRVEPADLSILRVRCRSGVARCTLTLFPA